MAGTGAGSLVHFDIHIGTVMILKAAIKLTVRTQGVCGGEMLECCRAAPITACGDYTATTSCLHLLSLLCVSSLSPFLSLSFLTYTYPE